MNVRNKLECFAAKSFQFSIIFVCKAKGSLIQVLHMGRLLALFKDIILG